MAAVEEVGERPPGAEQVGLPDELVERPRSHPGREGDVGHAAHSL